MAANNTPKGSSLRLPISLSISDIISILSVAVSVTLAWGYFGARITAIEHDIVILKERDIYFADQITQLHHNLNTVESHQRGYSIYLDEVFHKLGLPPPRALSLSYGPPHTRENL